MQDYTTDGGVELLIVFLEEPIERYNPLNGNSLFNCIAGNSVIDAEQLRVKCIITFGGGEYHSD